MKPRLALSIAALGCGSQAFRCALQVPDHSGWTAALLAIAPLGWVLVGLEVGTFAWGATDLTQPEGVEGQNRTDSEARS